MASYETDYGIGDVVYTANRHDVEKQIITKLKIVGLKHKVSYGFKESGGGMFAIFKQADTWYSSSEVFKTKESALRKHEQLKEKHEIELAQEEAEEKAERKAELLKELEELENE